MPPIVSVSDVVIAPRRDLRHAPRLRAILAVIGAAVLTGCGLFEPQTQVERDIPEQSSAVPAASDASSTELNSPEDAVAAYIERVEQAPRREDLIATLDSSPATEAAAPSSNESAAAATGALETDSIGAGVAAHQAVLEDKSPTGELLPAAGATQAAEPEASDSRAALAEPRRPAAPRITGLVVNGSLDTQEQLLSSGQPEARRAEPTADRALRRRVAELADDLQRESDDLSFRTQLDQRILRVMAGDDPSALEPLELISDEQQAIAQRVLEALVAIRNAHQGNLDRGITEALGALDALSAELAAVSELSIPRLAICQLDGVRGFGDVDLLQPPHFVTGRPIQFAGYIEIDHLTHRIDEQQRYETRLDLTTEVFTANGMMIDAYRDRGIIDHCQTRRRDFFLARAVMLPATLSPGDYVLKVTVADTISGRVAVATADFRVNAR